MPSFVVQIHLTVESQCESNVLDDVVDVLLDNPDGIIDYENIYGSVVVLMTDIIHCAPERMQ